MIAEIKSIKLKEVEEEIARLKQNPPKYSWINKNFLKSKEYTAATRKHEKQIKLLEDKKKEYLAAKSLISLELTFEQALDLLNENGINAVLTKNDTFGTKKTKPIDSLDDIILIHKSNHLPINSRLSSVSEANITGDLEYKLGGHDYKMSLTKQRNTVHFTANGEVSSHFFGSWEDKKYAVLIPLSDVPKKDIGSARSNDTFVIGGVTLTPNTWILVPKGERQQAQKNNPQVNIIEYEGVNVTGYANQLVMNLGYTYERTNEHGWINEEDRWKYDSIVKNEGLDITQHSSTKYSFLEKFLMHLEKIRKLLYYAYENENFLKDKDFENDLYQKLKFATLSQYEPNKEQIIKDLCNYFKDTPFMIDASDFQDYHTIKDVLFYELPRILMNKLHSAIAAKEKEDLQLKPKKK